MKMNDEDKNVYHFQVQHGEVFVHNGKVIASWHENDGSLSGEIEFLLNALGYEVIYKSPAKFKQAALSYAEENGLLADDDSEEDGEDE